MDISLATDQFGRLICRLSDGASAATVTASNVPDAAHDLLSAMERARGDGFGEAFWREGGGQYRWVFRREGAHSRMAVIWSSGTVTGWEHVFWGNCDLEALTPAVRTQAKRLGLLEVVETTERRP